MLRPFNAVQTEMYYKQEKSPGNFVTGVPWKRLRLRSESLTQSFVVNEERRADGGRSLTGLTLSEQEISGTIGCILSPQDIDIFLESTLRNKWSTLRLSQGNIDRTFSFLVVKTDAGRKFYTLYTGCVVATVDFNFQVNSYVSFDLAVIGTNVDHNYTPSPHDHLLPSSENDFFIGLDGELTVNGNKEAFVTAFSGSFGYAHDAIRVIDPVRPYRLRTNEFNATAQLVVAFDGQGAYSNYINATSFNLKMQVQYKGERYSFIFPRCVITAHQSPSSGVGSIIATADITPIYSKQYGSTVIVTKHSTK